MLTRQDRRRYERYTLAELFALPTIRGGHFDNLKMEADGLQWWVTRCGPADGNTEDGPISVEESVDGVYETVHHYGDWNEWLQENGEPANEPEEGDWTTEDHIHFYEAGLGREVFEVPYVTLFGERYPRGHRLRDERVNMERALRKHFKKIGYFPNVWFISDHGNAHLISVNERTGRYLFG